MSQPTDTARNAYILVLRRTGMSFLSIAKKFHITRQRVAQLCSRHERKTSESLIVMPDGYISGIELTRRYKCHRQFVSQRLKDKHVRAVSFAGLIIYRAEEAIGALESYLKSYVKTCLYCNKSIVGATITICGNNECKKAKRHHQYQHRITGGSSTFEKIKAINWAKPLSDFVTFKIVANIGGLSPSLLSQLRIAGAVRCKDSTQKNRSGGYKKLYDRLDVIRAGEISRSSQ